VAALGKGVYYSVAMQVSGLSVASARGRSAPAGKWGLPAMTIRRRGIV
jgi:hypothetical protein